MISQKINLPLFYEILRQELPWITWATSQESYAFRFSVLKEPISIMVEEFFKVFDAETVQGVQKNINQALTASKHLLSYDKQDLIWFQRSLSRMKRVRNAFKD